MTIADEIAREFAKSLAEKRAAARQQLVASAADTEKTIREKRPRKSKEPGIVEEAHPGEVFVAESDGLGGMVGNLEQVHEQIMNALNRRPSAFPYQGLVANAMLDFQKTAETLESHDLYDEADAVRKIAQDLLTVLQRRATNLDGPPSFLYPPEGFEPSSETLDADHVIPEGAKRVDRPSPASSAQAAQKPKALPPAAAVKGVDNAKKSISAFNKLKGFGGKILGPLGLVGTAWSLIDTVRSGDWASLATSGAGAAVGAGAALAGLTSAPVLTAIGVGATVTAGIRAALTATMQDDIDTDLPELAADIESELSDDSYDPDAQTDPDKKAKATVARKSLETMRDRINDIMAARKMLQREASKGDQVDPGVVGIAMASIAENNRALGEAFAQFEKAGSELDMSLVRDTLGFGFPKIKNRISDVNESVLGFESEMDELYASVKPQVDIIRMQLEEQEGRATQLMKDVSSGAATGYGVRSQLGVSTKLKSDVDNPEHIKEIQGFLKVPKTGKWDEQTMDRLMNIRNKWIGFHIDMGKYVTRDALKASTVEELQKLNDLWENRYSAN